MRCAGPGSLGEVLQAGVSSCLWPKRLQQQRAVCGAFADHTGCCAGEGEAPVGDLALCVVLLEGRCTGGLEGHVLDTELQLANDGLHTRCVLCLASGQVQSTVPARSKGAVGVQAKTGCVQSAHIAGTGWRSSSAVRPPLLQQGTEWAQGQHLLVLLGSLGGVHVALPVDARLPLRLVALLAAVLPSSSGSAQCATVCLCAKSPAALCQQAYPSAGSF